MRDSGVRFGSDDAAPCRVLFLLIDGYELSAVALAVEALAHANRLAERHLYDWTLAGTHAPEAISAAGPALRLAAGLDPACHADVILLCAGEGVQAAAKPRLVAWLRRLARRGAIMGSIGAGAWTLAAAGLLDGRAASLRRDMREAFAEAFPRVTPADAEFVVDHARMTAAEGLAAAALMRALIAATHGAALAAGVARAQGLPDHAAPAATGAPAGPPPRLAAVLAMMRDRLEEPLPPARLAEAAGLSTRQLERLFRQHFQRAPKRYYMEMRLEKARQLLRQTPMSVIEVGMACGFTAASHFSKCYRAFFGVTPYRERAIRLPPGVAPDVLPLPGTAGSPPAAG